MHVLWLVLTYDLSEDRRIDDDSAQFKFDSWVILWTFLNSLLSIATNQFVFNVYELCKLLLPQALDSKLEVVGNYSV